MKFYQEQKCQIIVYYKEIKVEDIIIAKDIKLEDYIKNKVFNIEEAVRGNIKKLGDLTFKIKGNEGYIPHFHIEGSKVDTCVCIFVPLYFHHRSHKNTSFDGKTKEALNEFLNSPYRGVSDSKITIWEYLRNIWLELYYDNADINKREVLKNHFIIYGLYDPHSRLPFIPKNSVQPNYISMYGSIHE